MRGNSVKTKIVAFLLSFTAIFNLTGDDLDTIGVTLLRQVQPSLTGTGVSVGLSESGDPNWQVNPAAVGHPASLFTWISAAGSANTFPNALGSESAHANYVGVLFFGNGSGVAPQVTHVDNYEANYFYSSIISSPLRPAIAAKVMNQSWIAGSNNTLLEQNYDNYADERNVLFVSGIGNGGPVYSPATAYNGIGVGVHDGPSSYGPTVDGRSKPDLVGPGGFTSWSTALVSGSGTVLIQAATAGHGGTNVSAGTDIRTVKALLLNGALKPSNWTNGPTTPLDARYGSGIVNVFNAYQQLAGGKRTFIEATSHTSGGSHPPGNSTSVSPSLSGWDFAEITNDKITGTFRDKVHHYYFSLTNSPAGNYTATATLVWNRPSGSTSIKNLDLFLYNRANNALVAASTSGVDNVEHLFIPALPAGNYDLQVLKNADASLGVANGEEYALAFEFFTMRLNIERTGTNTVITWPIAPTGFILQSTATLTSPSWTPVIAPVVVSNNLNVVSISSSTASQFFRLRHP